MKELEKKEIQQEKTFQELAEPLMKWLDKHYHPYTKVILTSSRAEIVEGIEGCSFPAGEWGYETE